MPVFISHKQEDTYKANQIAAYLQHNGVLCYIDSIDNYFNTGRTPEDLTNHIIEKIRQCTHFLAFITFATRTSWWVPFEIGTANQMARKIVTCSQNYRDLPEYLKTWPVLETESDHTLRIQLDKFIHYYQSDSIIAKSINERSNPTNRVITPEAFNRELKAAFSQR